MGHEGEIFYTRPRMDDLPAIVDLLGSDLGEHYRMRADDPAATRIMRAYVDGERKSGVVARCGDQVAGFLLYDLTELFSPTGSHARADYAVVAPRFRRRGIMTGLLRRAWAQAEQEGAYLFFHKSSVPVMVDLFRRMPEPHERGAYFFVPLAGVQHSGGPQWT